MKKLFIVLLSVTAVGVFAQEMLKNNTLDKWKKDSSPVSWHGGKKEYAIVPDGYEVAVKVQGNIGQMTQVIKLQEGSYYLISGMICKGGGNNKTKGMIGIRDGKYKWKIHLNGSDKTSEWQKVSKVYKADGKERYFYCLNWYMGKNGVCYYAGLSLKKITQEEAKKLEKNK
jgi:hypothetical protein